MAKAKSAVSKSLVDSFEKTVRGFLQGRRHHELLFSQLGHGGSPEFNRTTHNKMAAVYAELQIRAEKIAAMSKTLAQQLKSVGEKTGPLLEFVRNLNQGEECIFITWPRLRENLKSLAAAKTKTKPATWTPKELARGKEAYSLLCNLDLTVKSAVARFKEKATKESWLTVSTDNGLKDIAVRYAEYKGLDPIPRRQDK